MEAELAGTRRSSVGASYRRYLHADHQGSIIAHSDSSGAAIQRNAYDAYGIPKSGNDGRFGFTGQTWIPQLGLNYYKARFYSPKLGRFLQTDPIFYKDDFNLYAYVGNDPMNRIDPSGLRNCPADDKNCVETPESAGKPGEPQPPTPEQEKLAEIVVTAHKNKKSTDGVSLVSDKEKFFVVSTDGLVGRGMTTTNVPCGGGLSVDVGRPGPLAAGTAGAHTHGPNHDSTPGPGDNIAAKASSTKSAFVMTPSNAFMIRSFGDGTYATNVLSGPALTSDQTSALTSYMQGWEGPTVNNTSLTDKQRFCPK